MVKYACQKIPYESREEALRDIKFMKDQQRHFSRGAANAPKAGRKMRVYVCPHCGKWHVTTKKKHFVK